jgi:hypothetical protein
VSAAKKREVWFIEKKALRADESKYLPHEHVKTERLAKEKADAYNSVIADCEYRAVKYIPEKS